MSTLPNTLSALILVALDDLEACERDPQYVIDMQEWHTPHKTRCSVCLAGAVMAQSLDLSPHHSGWDILSKGPSDATVRKILALNYIRSGDVQGALIELGQDPPPELCSFVDIPLYTDDVPGFKAALRDLAARLVTWNL